MSITLQKAAIVAACAAVAATSANAAIINLRFESNAGASGTLGGSAFNSSTFRLDLQVDNASWVSGSSIWANANSATVTIGSNTYQFNSALKCYWVGNGAVGVSRASGADIFGFYSSSLISWDKQSAVGPVSESTGGNIVQWTFGDIMTNAGILNVNSNSGFAATFTANGGVPAPGAVALLGLAGLSGRRRRR